ncbi:hypothetical protein D3C76_1885980 [compost metagenome]
MLGVREGAVATDAGGEGWGRTAGGAAGTDGWLETLLPVLGLVATGAVATALGRV